MKDFIPAKQNILIMLPFLLLQLVYKNIKENKYFEILGGQ